MSRALHRMIDCVRLCYIALPLSLFLSLSGHWNSFHGWPFGVGGNYRASAQSQNGCALVSFTTDTDCQIPDFSESKAETLSIRRNTAGGMVPIKRCHELMRLRDTFFTPTPPKPGVRHRAASVFLIIPLPACDGQMMMMMMIRQKYPQPLVIPTRGKLRRRPTSSFALTNWSGLAAWRICGLSPATRGRRLVVVMVTMSRESE